jgi:hypothetical protein
MTKIEFQPQKIQLEQFEAFEDQFDPKKNTAFSVELEVLVSTQQHLIILGLWVDFHQGRKTVIKIGVRCHYLILEASWEPLFDRTNNRLVIPKAFGAHLAIQTLGTVRGILFEKTQETAFSKLILPSIDADDLFSEDIYVELEN